MKNRKKGTKVYSIRIGCSPDKETVLKRIFKRFNSLQFRLKDQKRILVEVVPKEDRELARLVYQGEFGIICPDSTIWLEQIEDEWHQRYESDIIQELAIFAVSPLVIALNPSSAKSLGYPNKRIGWSDILNEVQKNQEFSWMHTHILTTTGSLTAFTEFHVAANMPKELSIDHIQNDDVINGVRNLEQRIQQYGSSDKDIISHSFSNGKWHVDAFVAQQVLILSSFKKVAKKNHPIIIYPKEGAIWINHPVVFLSNNNESSTLRECYEVIRDYLLSIDAQSILLQEGFYAVGPHIRSYLKTPNTASLLLEKSHTCSEVILKIPSASILENIANKFSKIKRRSAVYLLADVSGSMAGEKLEEAKKGLLEFLNQFRSLNEYVGLISFESIARELVPIGQLHDNIDKLRESIHNLIHMNRTALFDALAIAHDNLQRDFLNISDPIRAIVVMTDGLNNGSRIGFDELKDKIIRNQKHGFKVKIFGLAYGKDSDLQKLKLLSEIAGGSAVEGTLDNIKEIYNMISKRV